MPRNQRADEATRGQTGHAPEGFDTHLALLRLFRLIGSALDRAKAAEVRPEALVAILRDPRHHADLGRVGLNALTVTADDVYDLVGRINRWFESHQPATRRTGKTFRDLQPVRLSELGKRQWREVEQALAAFEEALSAARAARTRSTDSLLALLGNVVYDHSISLSHYIDTELRGVHDEAVHDNRQEHDLPGVGGEGVTAAENRDEPAGAAGQNRSSGAPGLPRIQREEITRAETETASLQEKVAARFQRLLNDLEGRKAESDEEGKWTARAINELARNRGVTLYKEDKPVYLGWASRVFEVRLAQTSKREGPTSAGFPRLTAQLHSSSEAGRGG